MVVEYLGSPRVLISLHVGASVAVDCRRGGERHRGTAIHGDLEIIPPNLGGVWEIKSRDTALVIVSSFVSLDACSEESRAEIRGTCHAESPIAFRPAIRRRAHRYGISEPEMESGYPLCRTYMDALATGLRCENRAKS